MAKQRKFTTNYFTEETEQAIIDYVKSDNSIERNDLFNYKIFNPFMKLTEYWMNALRSYDIGDSKKQIQHEAINNVIDKLKKFNPENGKAYSYFSIVIRNYFLNERRKLTIERNRSVDLGYFSTNTFFDNNHDFGGIVSTADDNDNLYRFILSFKNIVQENLNSFFIIHLERMVVTEILNLFNTQSAIIGKINKRNVYKHLRTTFDTIDSKYISNVIKHFKEIYEYCKLDYIKNGFINAQKIKSKFTHITETLIDYGN